METDTRLLLTTAPNAHARIPTPDATSISFVWMDKSQNTWVANYTPELTLNYQFAVDRNTSRFIPSPDGQWGVLETILPGVMDVGAYRLVLVSSQTQQHIPLLSDRIDITAVQWSPDSGEIAILSRNLTYDLSLDIFDSQGHRLQQFDELPFDNSGIAWLSCDLITDPSPSVLAQLPSKSHN
jgi:hypothetical protein